MTVSPADDADLVVAVGHPGQRRHRLALRAGADQHDLARRAARRSPSCRPGARRARAGSRGRGRRPCCGPSTGRRRRPCRPCAAAASSTCWTRCTWRGEAGHDDPLLGAVRTPRRGPGRCRARLVTKPGTSALVESDSSRSTPSAPSRAKPARSVSRPSSGSWSILKSPVCSTRPGRGADRDRERVGDRVVDREELAVEGAERSAAAPRRPRSVYRRDPVLGELGLDQRQGQLRADQRDVGALAQQVRDGADVVLVAVREDDGLDVVEPVS